MLPKANLLSQHPVNVVPKTPTTERALEVVIPFTTLAHSQRSIQHAEWLCAGLNASIRVIGVLQVPYPLDLDRPRVSYAAIAAELVQLRSHLPVTADLWFSRDWIEGFLRALPEPSLVILCCHHRLLRSREEKLGHALKRAGHRVSMFLEDNL